MKLLLLTISYFFVALIMTLSLVGFARADAFVEPNPLALVNPCEPAQRDYFYQYPDKIDVPKYEQTKAKPVDEPEYWMLLLVSSAIVVGWMAAKSTK